MEKSRLLYNSSKADDERTLSVNDGQVPRHRLVPVQWKRCSGGVREKGVRPE